MNRNALIIGDSYSTFRGYVPEGYEVYYAEEIIRLTDLTKVTQTWWHRVMAATGLNLVLNDSWCGAPIGYTGYDGEDCSHSSSFLYRLRKLRDSGFFREHEIGTVFVFGGTNDSWCDAPLGDLQYEGWTEQDLYRVLPAMCCFFQTLRQTLPEARIYCLINKDLKPEITHCMEEACRIHCMIPVTFPHMDRMGDHPTIMGMTQISDAVLKAMDQ